MKRRAVLSQIFGGFTLRSRSDNEIIVIYYERFREGVKSEDCGIKMTSFTDVYQLS